MIKKRIRTIDKFTGEKLIPIQVWVPVKTYDVIKDEANKSLRPIKNYLRGWLEQCFKE